MVYRADAGGGAAAGACGLCRWSSKPGCNHGGVVVEETEEDASTEKIAELEKKVEDHVERIEELEERVKQLFRIADPYGNK